MSEITVSEQHCFAVKLHQNIMASASLAQQNIWDMCEGLKKMRDDKLYKELGYQNFENYCEKEFGFSRMQAHKYISIIENINTENVNSSLHLGVSKLYLLSSISEQEQTEIAGKLDLENTTVKELKAEIDKLKSEKHDSQSKLSTSEMQRLDAENRLKGIREHNSFLEQQLRSERGKNKELASKVEELESRPIEVAVAEPSDTERRLQETIDALQRESLKHDEELEAQYMEDERAVRAMLEEEKQKELAELSEEYEAKIKAIQESGGNSDNDEIFKLYKNSATDAFARMLDFVEKAPEKEIYKGEVERLVRRFAMLNNDI